MAPIVPLLVGWESDGGLYKVWGGARGGFEHAFIEAVTSEPSSAAIEPIHLSGWRYYGGGVARRRGGVQPRARRARAFCRVPDGHRQLQRHGRDRARVSRSLRPPRFGGRSDVDESPHARLLQPSWQSAQQSGDAWPFWQPTPREFATLANQIGRDGKTALG